MPTQKRPDIEKALEKTADVWISGIELALAEFDKLDHLPHRLFLCGGGSSLDMLMSRLEEASWYKSLRRLHAKPSVHHIRPEQVVGIKDVTGKVNDHTFITAMGLLRVGLDTLQLDGSQGGSIREKIGSDVKHMSAPSKDTIYIDIDDEITAIIDKLRGSSAKVVAFVLPKRATTLQSIVNMKLLKRAADQEKEKLSFGNHRIRPDAPSWRGWSACCGHTYQ